MDNFKQPAFALSAVNSVAIVGVIVYMQKQLTTMQHNINDLTSHIQNIVKQMTSDQQSIKQVPALVEGLKRLDEVARRMQKNQKHTESDINQILDEEESINEIINSLTTFAEGMGGSINKKQTKQVQQKQVRSNHRYRNKREDEETEQESEEELSKVIDNERRRKRS